MGTAARWALAIVLAGVGIVEALDRFGASPVLPAFFPLLPVVLVLLIAFGMRSLGYDDVVRGGALGGSAIGLAVAGGALSTVVLVAAPLAVALGGRQGVLLALLFLIGLALALFRVMPDLRSTGAATLSSAIGRRFGAAARPAAALAVIGAVLPILAAEARLAGSLAERMLGIPATAASDLLVILALIAAIFGGARSAIAVAAGLVPAVAFAYFVPVSIAALDAGWLPTPFAGLFDPHAFEAATRIPSTILLPLGLSLLAGVATMPTLLFPAWTVTRRIAPWQQRATTLAIVAAVLLAAPSYAVFGKLHGIDAATNPAGLVANFAEAAGLSAAPAVLLIGGIFATALVTLSIGLATIGAAFGNDLFGALLDRGQTQGRRIFASRIGMLFAAAAALSLGHRAGGIGVLACLGLSIGAAALGPLLLVGWRRVSVGELPAAGAIAVGLAFVAADFALATFLAGISAKHLGMGAVAQTILGPTGWFGLPVGLAGGPGLIAGLLGLGALTLLDRLLRRSEAAPAVAPESGVAQLAGPQAPLLLPAPDAAPSDDRPTAPAHLSPT